ncbi:putative non-ribosomal peptide synthetase domain protein [Pseudomonas putida S610]|nr:putative non-ribosomal peptide synthetase domain protein [Pseudomonas putida S610]
MGETVGMPLQLGIRPLLLAMYHSAGTWRTLGLCAEQCMQRLIAWIVAYGRVEAVKHPFAFARRQARNLPQRRTGRLLQGLRQLA